MPSFRFDKALGIERDIRARVEFKQIRSEIESKRQESESPIRTYPQPSPNKEGWEG